MGTFDTYRPKPEIACPVCGDSERNWQGHDGPSEWIIWEQGQAAPIDERVYEEDEISPDRLAALRRRIAALRLPARFEIFTGCQCPTWLTAVGVTEDGVWTRTELLNPANAIAYPHENERELKKRLAAYAEHLDIHIQDSHHGDDVRSLRAHNG